MCLGPRFFICQCLIGIQHPIITDRPPQAMRMLIHTRLFCLLRAMPPTERRIHSAAARSANAFEGYTKTPPPLQGYSELPYVCVWCAWIKGLILEDGVAIYYPIRRYNFSPQKKGGSPKGCANLAPLYFKRILHPRFQLVCREMRRNPMEQTIPSPLLYQTKGCPVSGHPFVYYLWSLLHSSLLSECFFFHDSNSFCPSSLAYNFWITGERNQTKELMIDCNSSIT